MNDTVIGVIVGAIITVLTGAIGSEYAAWRERSRELKAIKSSIVDELTEQQAIIGNMKEVWEKTKTLIPSYIWDLKSCSATFDGIRQRLFLIKDNKLRNKIISYYKDLKSTIQVEGKRAGSLSKSDKSQNEQKEIADKFIALSDKAKEIQNELV